MLYIIVYNKNSILICEIKVSWLEKTGCLLCYPCNFVYLHFESGENVLIIYAPRECPSGSEGQTCGENLPDFIPFFVGLKVEKKIY